MLKSFRSRARMITAVACIAIGTTLPQLSTAQTPAKQYSGKIDSVFLSSGGNYAFRVTLSQNGSNPLTDCYDQFAYVNTSFDNYQAYVAELTTLYVRGTPITLSANKDSNGFCQLVEFWTSP